jgi:hypothetical protein
MDCNIEKFESGWIGASLELSTKEIEKLIERLEYLKNNPESHFHLHSDYEGAPGIGDIEFSHTPDCRKNNMQIG